MGIPQSVEQARTVFRPQARDEFVVIPDLSIDVLATIVMVRQRGICIGQGKLWEPDDNLVRRQALFRPENDVLDTNPVSGDTRSPPADPRRHLDVCSFDGC